MSRLILTIIIPTFRRTELLRQTIASLANQRDFARWAPMLEVILCDDTRDEPGRQANRSAFRDLMDRDANLNARYIPNEGPGGQSRNVNNGILGAHGEYILILHDDDLLHEAFLSRMMPVLETRRAACVAVDVERFETVPPEIEIIGDPPPLTYLDPRMLGSQMAATGTFVPSQWIFQNDPSQDIRYDETLDFVCDWERFVRSLQAAHRSGRLIAHAREPLVFYRTHPEGVTQTAKGMLVHYIEHIVLMRKFAIELDVFSTFALSPPEIDGFLERARRYRKRRIKDELTSLGGQILRSPQFSNDLDGVLAKQVRLNPLLVPDAEAIRHQINRYRWQTIGREWIPDGLARATKRLRRRKSKRAA